MPTSRSRTDEEGRKRRPAARGRRTGGRNVEAEGQLTGATFAPDDVAPYRILSPEGVVASGEDVPMSLAELREALWWMILSRRLDDFGTKLQRMGRIGLYGPLHGQEASTVGTASVLDPGTDWLVPAYREQAAWLRHGLPLATLMAVYLGRLEAAKIPEDVNMLPRQQSVAAQLPHAVGLGWAQALRGTGAIVMVYCGEGASSEGDFHEACNLAGVLRAPVVFVVQNNGWAISTPAVKQTAARSIAARAPGYGFTGYRVDGNDLFAVNRVARLAAARARTGQGPTLIENVTYRIGFHNTSDNPSLYRDPAEVEAADRLDPIARVERYMRSVDAAWSDGEAQAVRERADDMIKVAIRSASAHPANEWTAVFEHTYSELPARLDFQRSALAAEVDRD